MRKLSPTRKVASGSHPLSLRSRIMHPLSVWGNMVEGFEEEVKWHGETYAKCW